MSKAFWEGYWIGCVQASKYGIPIAIALIVGLTLGSWSHPYERCTVGKGFTNPEDIGECIWLLDNQPSLR